MSVNQRMYLSIAEGNINPAAREAAGEIAHEQREVFVDSLRTDRFYRPIDQNAVPRVCVDGRGRRFGPNAAGGTFSLVMGDALTHQNYRQPGETAPQHAERYYSELQQRGQEIGGHDDEHAHGLNCGCGAEDKLDNLNDPDMPSILEYITRRGDDIRAVLTSIGVSVSDDQHDLITRRAAELRSESYAATGAELRQAYSNVAGEQSVEHLLGQHNEIVGVINTQEDSIDREELLAVYGDVLEAFNIDVNNLRNGSKVLATSEAEAEDAFIGTLYYNLATAAVLANESLEIIVR